MSTEFPIELMDGTDVLPSVLSPIESQVTALSTTSPAERMLEVKDMVAFMRSELARIAAACDQQLIEWIKANGDLEVREGVRYYVGTEKTTKCNNVRGAVEALLTAGNGDLAGLCETLSANAIKPGAAKKILGEEVFGTLFTTEVKDDLLEGKPKKKLLKADDKYLPPPAAK